MKRRPSGIVSKTAECPECGTTVRWREQSGLKRFRPKAKLCQNCGETWR